MLTLVADSQVLEAGPIALQGRAHRHTEGGHVLSPSGSPCSRPSCSPSPRLSCSPWKESAGEPLREAGPLGQHAELQSWEALP